MSAEKSNGRAVDGVLISGSHGEHVEGTGSVGDAGRGVELDASQSGDVAADVAEANGLASYPIAGRGRRGPLRRASKAAREGVLPPNCDHQGPAARVGRVGVEPISGGAASVGARPHGLRIPTDQLLVDNGTGTYGYDGSSWVQQTVVPGGPELADSAVDYDPPIRAVVLLGAEPTPQLDTQPWWVAPGSTRRSPKPMADIPS